MITVAQELNRGHLLILIKHFVLLRCDLFQAICSFTSKVTLKPAVQVFFLSSAFVNCVRSYKTLPLCEQSGIFLKLQMKFAIVL